MVLECGSELGDTVGPIETFLAAMIIITGSAVVWKAYTQWKHDPASAKPTVAAIVLVVMIVVLIHYFSFK